MGLGRGIERGELIYANQEVVVTGGLGFLGSNLAVRLVKEGARVTIVDSLVKGCGGNRYNIASVEDQVRVIVADVADTFALRKVLRRASVIFNLAGEISHLHSMRFPRRDAYLNAGAQLRFLEECACSAPRARIVFAGTRQVYGVPRYLPVDEDHPVSPVDFNGIHKYAAQMYHVLYARLGLLNSVVLNLSNVYGLRMSLSVPCQGFLANFVRKAILRQGAEVFGDGTQLRDPIHADDAVEAFLAAGAAERTPLSVYNIGGPTPLSLMQMAEMIAAAAAAPPPVLRAFPRNRKSIDIGSYYADWSRFRRDFGWKPSICFREGMTSTVAFYRRELDHYIDLTAGEPECLLTGLTQE